MTVIKDSQNKRTPVKVSVIICTRNRDRSLCRTLESLQRLEIAPETVWEIIVVDNGSTDRTADVVARFSNALPVRRIAEEVPGLSVARNRGVSEAKGRFIVWTDDDVEVDRLWLSSYLAAFDRWPDIAIFGGAAVPVLEQPAVPWFEANAHLLRDLLAAREYGPDPLEMSLRTGNVPFGLNYAVRADLQRRFLYDPELGVAPGRRRSGEEVDFFKRALGAGYRGLCLPEPVVYHLVPHARQTVDYVRAYYESAGETWLVMRAAENRTLARHAKIVAKFVTVRLAYYLTRWSGRPMRYDLLIRDAFHTGVVQQLRNARREVSFGRIGSPVKERS